MHLLSGQKISLISVFVIVKGMKRTIVNGRTNTVSVICSYY